MFPGTKITIDGEDFIVPALSLGQLRNGVLKQLEAHDATLAEGKAFDAAAMRGDIILMALRRNYPDFPAEKLLDFLDMANTGPLWLVVLGASGFSPGETAAAVDQARGISAPSTEA